MGGSYVYSICSRDSQLLSSFNLNLSVSLSLNIIPDFIFSLNLNLSTRGANLHNYLTAGTDEVSMGMVKRVLYTATGGSCRDPEAVSYCRNKSGGQENV